MPRSDDRYLIPGFVPPDTLCETCGEPLEIPCPQCGGECGAKWRHVKMDSHDPIYMGSGGVYMGHCLRDLFKRFR